MLFFSFYTWAIQSLSHIFNHFHDLFEHRLLLKKYNLTGHILKRLFGDFQPSIDKQKKRSITYSMNFFYLSA